jgi:hypothetical protein
MTDLILVDYDERITNVAEILALMKKVGYEAITLAAPYLCSQKRHAAAGSEERSDYRDWNGRP